MCSRNKNVLVNVYIVFTMNKIEAATKLLTVTTQITKIAQGVKL